MKEKAIVLWSGGKDCNLALQLAKEEGYEIVALITFHSKSTEFRAHSREWMELQSKSLGIPHLLLEIQEPFAENYELQLQKLKDQLDVTLAVSGDISEVHGNSNWISDRAQAVGIKTFLPLWDMERTEVIKQLQEFDFEVLVTMVKSPWLDRTFVGRKMDSKLIEEFKALGIENGLDLCGEQGEYHTMVLNGPAYRSPILMNGFKIIQHEELFHLAEMNLSLDDKYKVPSLEKQKVCVQCGISFSCYTQGCWCAELPMIMPMENITDCLCPNCLKAAIDEKLNEK
ncbi:diphthine--ammonia ligase [Fluviicola taffensis]|uniref:Dph6-related ATP pyrophosphatase n=1 Tax=Fluviicola taffensis TaxID=191579 RepID=UPI0031380583